MKEAILDLLVNQNRFDSFERMVSQVDQSIKR